MNSNGLQDDISKLESNPQVVLVKVWGPQYPIQMLGAAIFILLGRHSGCPKSRSQYAGTSSVSEHNCGFV
jgi:hypothetical protein